MSSCKVLPASLLLLVSPQSMNQIFICASCFMVKNGRSTDACPVANCARVPRRVWAPRGRENVATRSLHCTSPELSGVSLIEHGVDPSEVTSLLSWGSLLFYGEKQPHYASLSLDDVRTQFSHEQKLSCRPEYKRKVRWVGILTDS